MYLNSPQYMPADIKIENKVSKREAVRLIFSQGKNMAFCYYVLGEESLSNDHSLSHLILYKF